MKNRKDDVFTCKGWRGRCQPWRLIVSMKLKCVIVFCFCFWFALSRQLNGRILFSKLNSIALYAKSCLARWFRFCRLVAKRSQTLKLWVGPIDCFSWTGLDFIFCRKISLHSSYPHFYSYPPKTQELSKTTFYHLNIKDSDEKNVKKFQISWSLNKQKNGYGYPLWRFVFGKIW